MMLRGLFSAVQCSNSRQDYAFKGESKLPTYVFRQILTENFNNNTFFLVFITKFVLIIVDLGAFLINFWPPCTANRFLAFAKETNLFSSKTLVCYSPNFVHLKRAKSIIKMDANFLFEYLLQSQSIILTERLKNRQLEVHRLIFTYTYGACAAVPDTGGRNQRFLIYLISYLFTRQPRLSKPKQYLKISNNKCMNQFYTNYGHTFIWYQKFRWPVALRKCFDTMLW